MEDGEVDHAQNDQQIGRESIQRKMSAEKMETLKKYLTYQLKDGSYAGFPGVVAMPNLLDVWFENFDFQDSGLKKHLFKGSENVDGNLISLAMALRMNFYFSFHTSGKSGYCQQADKICIRHTNSVVC